MAPAQFPFVLYSSCRPPPNEANRLCESERADSLGQPAHLAAGGVLVEHAARHAAGEFGLRGLERVSRRGLVPARDRGLDLLEEAADAAHAAGVDLRAGIVAADALLGLRRIGHVCP